MNRVLSGIENLDRVFFGYIPDKVFSFGSTIGPRWALVHVWPEYILALMQFGDAVPVGQ